mmetsp:Transcript_23376/g.59954  ORF Transcript_23376/g.59954 Transcript_23376/m.59954 type:complete len:212 (-) Transcript_23376:144-779(-)
MMRLLFPISVLTCCTSRSWSSENCVTKLDHRLELTCISRKLASKGSSTVTSLSSGPQTLPRKRLGLLCTHCHTLTIPGNWPSSSFTRWCLASSTWLKFFFSCCSWLLGNAVFPLRSSISMSRSLCLVSSSFISWRRAFSRESSCCWDGSASNLAWHSRTLRSAASILRTRSFDSSASPLICSLTLSMSVPTASILSSMTFFFPSAVPNSLL